MNHSYEDIRSRIDAEPVWFDEHAVPRYCEFAPNKTANIYADEAVLLLIECQGCGTEFKVCFSSNQYEQYRRAFSMASYQAMNDGRVLSNEDVMAKLGECSLAAAVENDSLHFGDPPNVFCCAAGPTMNSVPVRVLEFWRKEKVEGAKFRDWLRVPEFERAVEPDWMRDDLDDETAAQVDEILRGDDS